MPRARPRFDLAYAAAAGFAVLIQLPFLNKAYHADEAFFLPVARHMLADPAHPLDFDFNWYGITRPMAVMNNTPPYLYVKLAGALALTGGVEWRMRLLFLPFDMIMAAALLDLARRHLKRPLLPVLLLLAAPSFLVTMGSLLAEKPMAALGFAGLAAFGRWLDGRREGWFWASAALLALALLSKYAAVLFLPTVLAWGASARVRPARLAGLAAAAAAPLALHLLWGYGLGPRIALGSAWDVVAEEVPRTGRDWAHKLRSLLAFTGGCGLVTALWPGPLLRRRPALLGGAALASLFLFLPAWDLARAPYLHDRLAGIVLAWGGLLSLAGLLTPEARREPGWPLWSSWAASAAALQLFVYWTVAARVVLVLLPPLVFSLAARLEKDLDARALRLAHGASLACVLALSLGLAWVDYVHAGAQRDLAGRAAAEARAKGRRLWFTGHWGLQYYLEREGARGLDLARGGWDEPGRGDVVVVPRANTNILLPRSPKDLHTRALRVDSAVPLRLVRGWGAEAGFYSNEWGFLPFAFSREPVDEFVLAAVP